MVRNLTVSDGLAASHFSGVPHGAMNRHRAAPRARSRAGSKRSRQTR